MLIAKKFENFFLIGPIKLKDSINRLKIIFEYFYSYFLKKLNYLKSNPIFSKQTDPIRP